MKYCALYTMLLPIAYALLMLIFRYTAEQLNASMILALLMVWLLLPALFCSIGWLWIQRQPILRPTTLYICFILPLFFVLICNIVGVFMEGYDGFITIFGHFLLLLANAVCCVGIVGITALVRLLKRR